MITFLYHAFMSDPSVQPRIPLMRSTFFAEQDTREKLADFVRRTSRLSMGEECEKFEREFALYQQRKYAVLVGNGSLANLGLIQALLNLGRLHKGDRVGVSAVTWATNVMPLMQLGLVPVAIDCSIDHLNVTSATLEQHIDTLQAVFLTNALGFCGDIDRIRSLCDTHNVLLIEDNCESLGTRYQGKLLGNFGLASTFSFFVGHHLSTIEGGMICTDDEDVYHMLLMVRSHGWDRSLPAEKQRALRSAHGVDDFHARYTFYVSAYNLRPTEITGFLGALQLPLLEQTIERRERNFRRFQQAVTMRLDLYHPLKIDHIEHISNFAMPVIARSVAILIDTLHRFEAAGIEVRPIIAGDISLHPFWRASLPAALCPEAQVIHAQGFYFPNNADVTDEEVDLLCFLLQNVS
jgi:CDP-4-dehydro-6-deoxyglucose reductase, E1